jgi:hypothetical protein
MLEGTMEHEDSAGHAGKIGPGDVQWMTAAGGILHKEFHSREFTRSGGPFEMVQLWVNLPAADKMGAPHYQTLLNAGIPVVELPGGAGRVRVIAGEYEGRRGPAKTFSPINVWDVRLVQGKQVRFEMSEGHTLALVILRGSVRVNGAQDARDAQMVMLDRQGSAVEIEARSDTSLLLLGGQPLDEPIVGYGPFVMNTSDEINQAISDFNSGRFGRIPA